MNQAQLVKLAASTDEALRIGDLKKAEEIANEILKYNRSAGLAYKGIVFFREASYDLAEETLIESFQLNPKQHLALANLIPTYIKKRDFKKAVVFGEQAYAVMPNNISVAINYAGALLQEQAFEKALSILLRHHDPEKPNESIVSALVSCYRSLFMKEEANEMLDLALKHFGEKQDIIRLKADSLAESNPYEALATFEKVLERDNNNIATRWNMSLVQLRTGKFKEGWINYDYGLCPEVGKIGRPLPKLFEGSQLITDLDKLDKKKWTYLVCEQGIGDQILFLGVLSRFIQEFPLTVLIAEKRLMPILKRSFPDLPIYPYGAGIFAAPNHSIFNGYVPIGSMQKRYRNTREEFELYTKPYLIPDQQKVKKYREILINKTGGKRLVGFSWKGGFWERAQKTKTLDIELWDPIFANQDIVFVSLQYGHVEKEKNYISSKFKNVRWIEGLDFKKDLDGWFALACACDDILSVSTALVHFVGAAGRHVNLLLSDKGGPFIWGVNDINGIAYENVKIYRKYSTDDFSQYFKQVSAMLSLNENYQK